MVTLSAPPSVRTRPGLDVGEVHRDVGDVAGDADVAVGVGGDRRFLADVGAVEVLHVEAGLAVDDVRAVARIPLEVVVAGAHAGGVGADVAVDEVVAVAAEQQVGAVAAAQHVLAVAAVLGEVRQRADAVLARRSCRWPRRP